MMLRNIVYGYSINASVIHLILFTDGNQNKQLLGQCIPIEPCLCYLALYDHGLYARW